MGAGCADRREQARRVHTGVDSGGAADRGRSVGDRWGRTLSGYGSYSFSAMLKMKFATISNCSHAGGARRAVERWWSGPGERERGAVAPCLGQWCGSLANG